MKPPLNPPLVLVHFQRRRGDALCASSLRVDTMSKIAKNVTCPDCLALLIERQLGTQP